MRQIAQKPYRLHMDADGEGKKKALLIAFAAAAASAVISASIFGMRKK